MAIDLGQGFKLRQATAEDHPALLSICLKTGDAGEDATEVEDDPNLVGIVYAAPYQVLEPGFCFIVEDGNGPCGYVMGTPDTERFDARLAAEWFPPLQKRVKCPAPDPAEWTGSDWLRDKIYHPVHVFPKILQPYPAQGHIDLLPCARGKGIGKASMSFLMNRLYQAGAPGIHLHVSPRNSNAQQFYLAIGFEQLDSPDFPDHTVFMARRLP